MHRREVDALDPRRPHWAAAVVAPITTFPGSASAWRRAARFGVSPLAVCSTAAVPAPISPTTTSPVAIPIRVRFDDLEAEKRPASSDPSFAGLWCETGDEAGIVGHQEGDPAGDELIGKLRRDLGQDRAP